jgi:hypothetical protein
MTIVGFKKIFEKINRYIEKQLPQRMRRLAAVKISATYDNESDTFALRWEEETTGFDRMIQKLFPREKQKPTIFEPLSRAGGLTSQDPSLRNVYVEKNIPSKEIVGIKILEYTKCGPTAFEAFLGAIVDTLFEPSEEHDENIHLITDFLMQRLDWQRFAAGTA